MNVATPGSALSFNYYITSTGCLEGVVLSGELHGHRVRNSDTTDHSTHPGPLRPASVHRSQMQPQATTPFLTVSPSQLLCVRVVGSEELFFYYGRVAPPKARGVKRGLRKRHKRQ